MDYKPFFTFTVAGVAISNLLDHRRTVSHLLQVFPDLKKLPHSGIFSAPPTQVIETDYREDSPYLRVLSLADLPPEDVLYAALTLSQPVIIVRSAAGNDRYRLFHVNFKGEDPSARQFNLTTHNAPHDFEQIRNFIKFDIVPATPVMKFESISQQSSKTN